MTAQRRIVTYGEVAIVEDCRDVMIPGGTGMFLNDRQAETISRIGGESEMI